MRDVSFQELVKLAEILRGPDGCPWDRIQTLENFVQYIADETKEVQEALKKHDYPNLKEELGDLLFNIIMTTKIAEEGGHFSIYDMLTSTYSKIARLHEHVFGGKKAETAEEALTSWYTQKEKESKR